MNRSFLYAVAISFVIAIVVADDEINPTENVETVTNTFTNMGNEMLNTGTEASQVAEEELTEAINNMITYFTKSITDMTNISEAIENISESSSETTTNDLVETLMSYVEDTDMMKQQIGKVMRLRMQCQDNILKRLYDLPISEEYAKKMETKLREQIRRRMPGGRHFMGGPPHHQCHNKQHSPQGQQGQQYQKGSFQSFGQNTMNSETESQD